jgi:peptidoglycan/LPS O-acetylase OafA/YrhL
MVLFTHYRGWLPGGSIGVSVFFCLSGFLITRILLRLPDISFGNVAKFIFRRFMRVWPLMAFQIVLVLICMAILEPENLDKYLPFVQGLLTFTNGYGPWVGLSPAVLWTLRAEFWFYVLFPCVLFAVGRKRIVGVIVTGIVIGWLSKFLIGHTMDGWLAHFDALGPRLPPIYFTLVYLDQLMWGAACAVIIEQQWPLLRFFRHNAVLWLSLMALFLLATIPYKTYNWIWYLQTSDAALWTGIIILHQAVRPMPGDFGPLATIGRISFSIYLMHGVVIDYFPIYPLINRFNEQLGAVVAFVSIIGVSLITYRWIEIPFIRFSKRVAPFGEAIPDLPPRIAPAPVGM